MTIIVHPLYGKIPYLYVSQEDISQDMNFEIFLGHLKNYYESFKERHNWEIDFFIDKFLTSKENAREILKACQEGFYKSKNSDDYTIQKEDIKTERHTSDFANKIICLEKAYLRSIVGVRRSSKDRLTIEKANFLRGAFEELVKEETDNYIKVVNNTYRMLPVWLG